MQNTHFDYHWTWPPTAVGSQVYTPFCCQPLVTFARLPVTAESWSCQITEQPSTLSLPMTFLPWLIAPAGLFEEVKLLFLSFEMRGSKSKWLSSPLGRWIKDPSAPLRSFCIYVYLLIFNWTPYTVSGSLPTRWRTILQRSKNWNYKQGIITKCFVGL